MAGYFKFFQFLDVIQDAESVYNRETCQITVIFHVTASPAANIVELATILLQQIIVVKATIVLFYSFHTRSAH